MAKKQTNRTTTTTNTTKPVEDTTPVEKVEEVVETKVEEVVAKEEPKTAPKAEKPTEALVLGLKNYIANMNPINPMDDNIGSRHQKMLRGTIINALLDASEAQAIANIHYILSIINDDKTGVFSIRSLFRFYDVTAWNTKEDRREIESLLMFFTSTANPKTRAKDVDRMSLPSLQKTVTPNRLELIMRRLRMAYNLS